MKERLIQLGQPVLGREEKDALCRVIDSGWVTTGPNVREFERRFAEVHGTEDAVAVNSCTAGLHLALACLGIGSGDEVLLPSITFVATANAVLYVGATPVFVEIDDITRPHLSIRAAAASCTDRTRVVIVMHYGGYLTDLAAWRKFADERGLYLIEDAAHSPGVPGVGLWGDVSAFSFFTNKNMTTAEGGMVVARSAENLERIRRMRSHGMTTTTLDRDRGHAYSYDVVDLGYNYRMDELHAAIGIVQLDRLSEWNDRRRELTRLYRSLLPADVEVAFDSEMPTAAHLMPVILPRRVDRQWVMSELRREGIQTSIHYPPIHDFDLYRARMGRISLPVSEEFAARELTLPLHPSLTDDDVRSVARSIKRAMN